MGVKSYIGKSGETFWAAAAYARSKMSPGIKVEKERTGFTSQREATSIFKQLERECEREVLLKEAHGSTWGAVVKAFETHINLPKSALHSTTRVDYIAAARKHTMHWWRKSAAEITKADLREVFSQLTTDGYCLGHVKKIKVIINLIFVYGIENRLIRGIDQSPTVGLTFAREEEKVPEILSLAEIKKLLVAARDLNHEWFAEHLKLKKWTYKFKAGSKRYSFQKEIKDIRAILTWWSEHYDFSYKQPVKLFHSQLAVMEAVPEKERVISMEETLKFFKAMEFAQFWHDWVVIAFYCAGRASEIAGIHVGNIDLKERKFKIREVITWISGRPPIVKPFPKNGKARTVYINDTMYEIFERRLKDVPSGCPFLFHNRGKALRYGMILNAVNRGWKDAGLFPKFSGVHQLRYAGAQSARFLLGSIDAAAAVTGHSSIRMAASYSRQDTNLLNQSSVIAMEKSMRRLAPSAAEAG